jgi:hypothetical protein
MTSSRSNHGECEGKGMQNVIGRWDVNKFLIGKPEWVEPLGRPRHRKKGNNEGVKWI